MEPPDITVVAIDTAQLHLIKALLQQEHYRRCITTCRDLIRMKEQNDTSSPLQHAFIALYLAMAQDELARSMHVYSAFKLPALSHAEQFYRDALQSLPTAEQCLEQPQPVPSQHVEPAPSPPPSSASHRFSSSTLDSIEASWYLRSPQRTTSIRNDNLARTKSPPIDSPMAPGSDLDDLESHDSFAQIMTPNRVSSRLQRDYSSMTLISPADEQQRRPTSWREFTRPPSRVVDPNSAQFHPPPPARPPPAPPSHQRMQSRLPRLNTRALSSSPVRKQLRTASEQASPVGSPVSPISPLAAASVASNASTVSPISPQTPHPFDARGEELPNPAVSRNKSNHRRTQHLQALETHLSALRVQLHTHIRLVEAEKQRTTDAQTERAELCSTSPLASKASRKRTSSPTSADQGIRPLPPSYSFWSFTPASVKEVEKQRRVVRGRERGWRRERFDARRYHDLAERAMAEL